VKAVKLAKHFFDKQKTPGSIVMTSSTAGITGDMYNPAYMASKHGVSIP
jgi:NAD(P)-dependent dehydrogenase (short-subunit alcohol dehydrogenase family)